MNLSIILPVYNTALFLRQNLDSILSEGQDKSIEIIAVNDGSKDNSAAILDEYATQYPQMKVFHRPNAGVYPVRNFAISQATGAYIWMLDSDDYLLKGALDRVFTEISQHPDLEILNLGYKIEYKNKTVKQEHALSEAPICSGIDYLQNNFGSFFLWRNVYKRSFLEKHHLKFDAQVFSLEDTLFNIRTYSLAEKIKVFKEAFYFYRYNDTSISKKNTKENRKKQGNSTIYVHQQLREDLNQMEASSKRYKAVLGQLNFSVMGFFYSLYKEKYPLAYIKEVYQIYKKNKLLPLKGNESRLKLKLFRWVINIQWPFVLICYLKSFR